MTIETKTETGPTVDANGAVAFSSVTITTSDNGDGFHSTPLIYKNDLGETVIDTRGTTSAGPTRYADQAKITTEIRGVNVNNATFSEADSLHVIQQSVTVVDTRPAPLEPQVQIPENNVPVRHEPPVDLADIG